MFLSLWTINSVAYKLSLSSTGEPFKLFKQPSIRDKASLGVFHNSWEPSPNSFSVKLIKSSVKLPFKIYKHYLIFLQLYHNLKLSKLSIGQVSFCDQ